jgi:hypothetical protein
MSSSNAENSDSDDIYMDAGEKRGKLMCSFFVLRLCSPPLPWNLLTFFFFHEFSFHADAFGLDANGMQQFCNVSTTFASAMSIPGLTTEPLQAPRSLSESILLSKVDQDSESPEHFPEPPSPNTILRSASDKWITPFFVSGNLPSMPTDPIGVQLPPPNPYPQNALHSTGFFGLSQDPHMLLQQHLSGPSSLPSIPMHSGSSLLNSSSRLLTNVAPTGAPVDSVQGTCFPPNRRAGAVLAESPVESTTTPSTIGIKDLSDPLLFHLVAQTLVNVHSTYPMFHIPTLLADVARRSLEECLLLALCGVGCFFCHNLADLHRAPFFSPQKAGELLIRRAEVLALAARGTNVESLEIVQAFLLIAIYDFGAGSMSGSYVS